MSPALMTQKRKSEKRTYRWRCVKLGLACLTLNHRSDKKAKQIKLETTFNEQGLA